MSAAAPTGCASKAAPLQLYRRRHPERTVLYRLVQQQLETWLARTREHDPDGFPVTASIERELRGYLTCGILAHGFPKVAVRQWVITFPKRLRYFLHGDPAP